MAQNQVVFQYGEIPLPYGRNSPDFQLLASSGGSGNDLSNEPRTRGRWEPVIEFLPHEVWKVMIKTFKWFDARWIQGTYWPMGSNPTILGASVS